MGCFKIQIIISINRFIIIINSFQASLIISKIIFLPLIVNVIISIENNISINKTVKYGLKAPYNFIKILKGRNTTIFATNNIDNITTYKSNVDNHIINITMKLIHNANLCNQLLAYNKE